MKKKNDRFELTAITWIDLCYGAYAVLYALISFACLPYFMVHGVTAAVPVIFLAQLVIGGCFIGGAYLIFLGIQMKDGNYDLWEAHIATYLFLAIWTLIGMLLANEKPIGIAHMVSYYARAMFDPINHLILLYKGISFLVVKAVATALLQFGLSLSALLLLVHPTVRSAVEEQRHGQPATKSAARCSAGVSIFGVLGMLVAVFMIVNNLHYFRPSAFCAGINGFALAQLLMSVVWLVSIYGAFRLQTWGRLGMIAAPMYFLFETVIEIDKFLVEVRTFNSIPLAYIGFCFAVFIATIFFFVHPNVVKQFKQ